LASIIKISELVTTSDLLTTDPVIINTGTEGDYTTKSITSQEFIVKALGWYGNVDGSILMIRSGAWSASPYTLPTDSGTDGQVLTTDGTNSSWQTVDIGTSLWEFDTTIDAITPVPPAASFPVDYSGNGNGKCWSVQPVGRSDEASFHTNADLTVVGVDGAILSYDAVGVWGDGSGPPAFAANTFDGKISALNFRHGTMRWSYTNASKDEIFFYFYKGDANGELMIYNSTPGGQFHIYRPGEVTITTNGIEIAAIYLTLGTATYIDGNGVSQTADQLCEFAGPLVMAADDPVTINSPVIINNIPISSGQGGLMDGTPYNNEGGPYNAIAIGWSAGDGLKITGTTAEPQGKIVGNLNTIAIGNNALAAGGENYSCVAIGPNAMRDCSGCQGDVAIGNSSLANFNEYWDTFPTAHGNTAVGHLTLLSQKCGSGNVAIGYNAAMEWTGVDDDGISVPFGENTYLGYRSGRGGDQCGIYNIAVGAESGVCRVGSNNILMGVLSQAEGNNNIVMGNMCQGGLYDNPNWLDNDLLGQTGTNSNIVISGQRGTSIYGERSSANIILGTPGAEYFLSGNNNLILGYNQAPLPWDIVPSVRSNTILISSNYPRAYCDSDGDWTFTGNITANGAMLGLWEEVPNSANITPVYKGNGDGKCWKLIPDASPGVLTILGAAGNIYTDGSAVEIFGWKLVATAGTTNYCRTAEITLRRDWGDEITTITSQIAAQECFSAVYIVPTDLADCAQDGPDAVRGIVIEGQATIPEVPVAPTDAASKAYVDSLNSIQTASDFKLNLDTADVFRYKCCQAWEGSFHVVSGGNPPRPVLYDNIDYDGNNVRDQLLATAIVGKEVWFSGDDGVTWLTRGIITALYSDTTYVGNLFNTSSPSPELIALTDFNDPLNGCHGTEFTPDGRVFLVAFADPGISPTVSYIPLAQGDTLVWETAGLTPYFRPREFSISNLVDVAAGTPTANQVLAYDAATAKFVYSDTVTTVNGLTGFASLSVGSLNNVEDGSPTEGQTIVWSEVDSEFKYSQAGGGGSGAVDSVNGQTGVVDLDIVDMGDYKPAVSDAGQGRWDIFDSNEGVLGHWDKEGSGAFERLIVNIVDSDGINRKDELVAVGPGTWYFSTNGEPYIETIVSSVAVGGNTGNANQNIVMNCQYTGTFAGPLRVSATNPGDGILPLATGDILVWNGEEDFVPQQIPVDSVNSQTGVVELGIQDMVDFELNAGDVITTIPYTWFLNGQLEPESGKANWQTNSGYTIRVSNTDKDGVDRRAAWEAVQATHDAGNTVTLALISGGVTKYVPITAIFVYADGAAGTLFGGGTNIRLDQTAVDFLNTVSTNTTLELSSGSFTPTPDPLVVGDVLVWDGVAAFKPEILELSSLSDVAGGTPTQGQTLVYNSASSEFIYETISGGGFGTVTEVNGQLPDSSGEVTLGIGDLDDVTLASSLLDDGTSLEIFELDQIVFASPSIPSGDSVKLYWQPDYGLSMAQFNDGATVSSSISVNISKGILLKAPSGEPIYLCDTSSGTPVLAFSNGSPFGADAARHGFSVSFTIPEITEDTSYTLPATDGTNGQVLATSGSGQLSWVDTAGGGGAVDSVNGQTGAVSLSVGNLNNVENGTPTNGQTLVWSDADSEFKYSQAGGGGGGAVDSVNGETGVVELGAFNLTDIDYAYSAPLDSVDRLNTTGSIDGNDGECFSYGGNAFYVSQSNAQGVDQSTYLPPVSNSPGILIVIIGGVNYSLSYSSVVPWQYGNEPDWIILNQDSADASANAPFFTAIANSSGSVIGVSTNQDPVVLPVEEGQVLSWNAVRALFEPVDRSVDSVNGQTGVVELGIQNMDDYEPNYQPFGAPYACGTVQFPGNGLWFISGTRLSFGAVDSDGTDMSAQIAAASGEIYWSYDGISWITATFNGSPGTTGDSRYIDITSGPPLPSISGSPGLYLAFGTPANQPVSLIAGDILVWDGVADFKPQQLPSGVGAVDSVNGETGVVELDIVNMGDFQYAQNMTGSGPRPYKKGTVNNPGKVFSSTTPCTISIYDLNGADLSPYFEAGATFEWRDENLVLLQSQVAISVELTNGGVSYGVTFPVAFPGNGNLDINTQYYLTIIPTDPVWLPLEQNDILVWDGVADFKPQQLSPAAPVDSVNSQTGVVELDVFDMTDVTRSTRMAGTSFNWTLSATPDYDDGVAFGYGLYVGVVNQFYVSLVDADGENVSTLIPSSGAGQFTWKFADNPTIYTYTYTSVGDLENSNNARKFNGPDDQEGTSLLLLAVNAGKLIAVDFTGGDPVVVPLAEGDVLVWDGASDFRPQPLTSGGGAVDSVNGETGVVELGIQNMDDFAYNTSTTPGRWTYGLTHGGNSAAGGKWYTASDPNYNEFRLSKIDADGVDRSAGIEAIQPGDQFTFTQGQVTHVAIVDLCDGSGLLDEGDYVVFRAQLYTDSCGNGYTQIGQVLDRSADAELFIGGPPITAEVDVPLASGDILVWDGVADFKPQQLSPDAPVDSVNGETGVVELGVMDMDDVDFNYSLPGAFFYDVKVASGSASAGQWGTDSLRWDPTDANGQVFTDPGGTVQAWYSGNGSDWTEMSADIATYGGDFYIAADEPVNGLAIAQGWTQLYISLAEPVPTPVALAAGDILVWDGLFDFKPQQPTPVPAAPVDSVNGETGVVELGIQDMDDFAMDVPLASGDILVWDGVADFKPQQPTPVPAAPVDSVNGETGVVELGIQDMDDFALDGPLVSGDVLVWDGVADFKPQQLPSGGGGAVDSVNGQTGVVELGLMDMDDVTYNEVEKATWEVISLATAQPGLPSGKAYVSNDDLRVSPIAIQGDVSAELLAWLSTLAASTPLTLIINGVEESGFVFSNFIDESSGTGSYQPRFRIDGSSLPSISVGDLIGIKQFNDFGGAIILAPANGEVLTYDSAIQEWRPSPIEISVEQLDDFALAPEEAFQPWAYSDIDGNVPASGTFQLWNSFIALSVISSNGTSWQTDLYAIQGSDVLPVQIKVAGVMVYDGTADSFGNAGSNRILFSLSDYDWISELSDGEEVEWSFPFFSAALTPLADGDVLTYNSYTQEWNPQPLELNDLTDTTYLNGTLTITALDEIVFTSTDNPVGASSKIALTDLGLGFLQHVSTGGSGFFVSADAAKGATILTSGAQGHLWVEGNPTGGGGLTNRPTLAISGGRQADSDPAKRGYYVGLTIPAGLTESTTYTLPAADGDSGQSLTTDGSEELSWTTMISLSTLQQVVAASTDFADFQARIANL